MVPQSLQSFLGLTCRASPCTQAATRGSKATGEGLQSVRPLLLPSPLHYHPSGCPWSWEVAKHWNDMKKHSGDPVSKPFQLKSLSNAFKHLEEAITAFEKIHHWDSSGTFCLLQGKLMQEKESFRSPLPETNFTYFILFHSILSCSIFPM